MLTSTTGTTLLRGLLERKEAAWRDFHERFEPVLLAVARRAGLRDENARDAVQTTFEVLWTGLRAGRYDRERGRLRSWLRGIASKKIMEAIRRQRRGEIQVTDGSDGTGFLNRIPDERELTDIFDRQWQHWALGECLREVRQEIDAKTFQMFALYALKGWPVERVAEHLGVSRNAVYISKSRVLSRLRRCVRQMTDFW